MKWYTLEESIPKPNEWGIFILKKYDDYEDWFISYPQMSIAGELLIGDRVQCNENTITYTKDFIKYWTPLEELEALLPKEKNEINK